MAAAETVTQSTGDRRANVVTGPLSNDFLRIEGGGVSPTAASQMAYHPAMFSGFQQGGGVLNITVVQARLAKNYGVTRMDPYCRLRVGAQIFETPTSYNGSKTPRWNKVIQCHITDNVKEFYIEMFDERTFSVDERIAWGLIKIDEKVFQGEMWEEWHSLSGKQGEEKEGMVLLVLQYKKMPVPVMVPQMGGPMVVNPMIYPQASAVYGYPPVMYAPQMVMQTAQPMYQPEPQATQLAVQEICQKDLQTLKEMCPGMDDEIIRSVLQSAGGNLDRAAAQLLEINNS